MRLFRGALCIREEPMNPACHVLYYKYKHTYSRRSISAHYHPLSPSTPLLPDRKSKKNHTSTLLSLPHPPSARACGMWDIRPRTSWSYTPQVVGMSAQLVVCDRTSGAYHGGELWVVARLAHKATRTNLAALRCTVNRVLLGATRA